MIEVLHVAVGLRRGDHLKLNNRFVGIEIGVHQADLARVMVNFFPFCRWHAVDPWAPYKANYKSHDQTYSKQHWDGIYRSVQQELDLPIRDGRLILHRKTSDAAVADFEDASVDLVFVDGLHTQEQVERDIRNYWPKLRSGGVMCGHDFAHPSGNNVQKAVEAVWHPFEIRCGYVWAYNPKVNDGDGI